MGVRHGGLPVIDHLGQGLRTWSPHIEGTNNSEAIKGSLTEGGGTINGLSGSDVLYGTSRDEIFYQESGDGLLVGGGGNDTLWAGADNDILDGGEGSDRLYGEGGDDTYIFRRGSGKDTIIDPDPSQGNVDTIWLGSNLTPEQVILRKVGDNLVLTVLDTTDSLTVQRHFWNDSPLYRIERIQFMDGTVWNESDIHWAAYRPTVGDDYIRGTAGDDQISALGGADTVVGLAGDDTIQGDADDDTLFGDDGNDTLMGGAGDDRLVGGPGQDLLDGGAGVDILDGTSGNDTYVFGRGSGHDTIDELPTIDGTSNTVVLGAGVLPTDMVLERTSYGLTLTIADTNDSLTITAWGTPYSPRELVDSISFADGTSWGLSEISSMLGLHGTDGDDVIYGFSTPDAIQGFGGSDQLYGLGGEDTLDGGPGIDA
ncbi:MAG: calcium-binding protein, partial [Thermodesulfobacteriota bacterium]